MDKSQFVIKTLTFKVTVKNGKITEEVASDLPAEEEVVEFFEDDRNRQIIQWSKDVAQDNSQQIKLATSFGDGEYTIEKKILCK